MMTIAHHATQRLPTAMIFFCNLLALLSIFLHQLVVLARDASSRSVYQVDARTGDEKLTELNTEEEKPSISTMKATENPHAAVPCGIWLAPSTIEGAGLGMFAGRDFKEGENLQDSGDIVIPLVDILHHNDGKEPFDFLFDEYTWNAESLLCDHEGSFEVNAASPGFGATANSFLPVYNVDEGIPSNDAAGLHRAKDPGAGAFSTYYGRHSSARRDIGQGEELFVSYGSSWFETRHFLGPIPLQHDLTLATRLYRQYRELKSKAPNLSSQILDDLWHDFIQNTTFNESRVIGAFDHDKREEEFKLLENHTLTQIRIQQSYRSPEWLAKHGTCGDHIKGARSKIEQAGRGAFATRDLPRGTVVAQLPLIHVTDRTHFDMYNFSFDDHGNSHLHHEEGAVGHQLMLNYCYGHAESSLLLCPYGPMQNFINHNQTLANVKLQWGDPARGNHMPELLENDLQSLERDATAKLAFELVATRHIAEGDEVYLDYGDEWEKAWQEHVKNWNSGPEAAKYVSAAQLNELKDNGARLRTAFQAIKKPYPSNVVLQCHEVFLNTQKWTKAFHGTEKEKADFIYDLDDDRKVADCEILRYKRVDGSLLYTAVLYEIHEDEDKPDRNELLKDVPKEAFIFVDRPYTTDMFLAKAFRHDIRIPDNMFPEAWRNYKKRGSVEESDMPLSQ